MGNPGSSRDIYRASDGYVWKYRHYIPDGPRRATIVCVHGIQSHAGWYSGSCESLVKAGFEVCFLDRRGSGMNSEARGDTPGFRRLLDDIGEFLHTIRDGRPVVLLAISWGGKVAVALERRHPGLVDALALLCPGFRPKVGLTFTRRMAVAAARMMKPRRLFDVPLSEPELFTANPEFLRYLRNDAASLRQATARFLVESVRLDAYLRWFPPRLAMPVLLMLAGRDRIIDNGATRALVNRLATGDLKVIEYSAAHHTLEFEPERPFVGDLLTWLDRAI
jgi:alpha-beta hydrolase superfamily lysophospholipase